jgi:hypothetical protein
MRAGAAHAQRIIAGPSCRAVKRRCARLRRDAFALPCNALENGDKAPVLFSFVTRHAKIANRRFVASARPSPCALDVGAYGTSRGGRAFPA